MGVYKVIRLVGTSPTSWEEAATNAVEEASKHLYDLRVSEVCASKMAKWSSIGRGRTFRFATKDLSKPR